MMREQITEFTDGRFIALYVFPETDEDTPEDDLSWRSHVCAIGHEDGGEWKGGVDLHINYGHNMTREQCARLKDAIDRCWEWVDRDEWRKESLLTQNDQLCTQLNKAQTVEEQERARGLLAMNEAALIATGAVSFGEPFEDLEAM